MLECVPHDNGVVTFQSPLLAGLGVIHAFSTRVGGISDGPYATLNLASLDKDRKTDGNTNIAENFRRLRRAIGASRTMRVAVRQVHGSEVWLAPTRPTRLRDSPCADGIISDQTNKMLTIRTADCVPILLANAEGTVVAAVHAGWRGMAANVIATTVGTMRQRFGLAATALFAAIGPHIGAGRFEVGEEVAAAFDQAELGACLRRDLGAKPHVDLGQAARLQLERLDIPPEQVDHDDGLCTYERADLFYSYRRDGAVSGRMAAVILARRV